MRESGRFGLANEYLKLGKPEPAILHLQHAVQHDPGYSAAWKRLGKALAETGRSGEAMAAYETGIRVAEVKATRGRRKRCGSS